MTQENEIKRPIQDLEHEPIKPLDNSEKGSKVSQALKILPTSGICARLFCSKIAASLS